MSAAMIRAARRWDALKINGFHSRQMDALKPELDYNPEEENDLRQFSVDARQVEFRSINSEFS